MEIIVLHNQSLLDVAILHTGSVENAFAIAVANGLSVSSTLSAGTILRNPNDVKKDNDVLHYYTTKDLQPATAITRTVVLPKGRGIGWMQIGNDFKVS